MKAFALTNPEGPKQFEPVDIDKPQISDDEVLIQVKAISINPVDIKTSAGGAFYPKLKDDSPIIVGWDVAGIVTEKGDNVTDFEVGDEVFGMVNFPGSGKAYAEYVAAPASHLAIKPAQISLEEAAATTLAALTAWQDLTQQTTIEPNQKVLIHAASGGVGHFAVQMAKYLGAYVIGTSSASNREFVLSLGADEHLDYKSQNFEETLNDIDVAIDIVGGDNIAKNLKVLKTGGTLISNLGLKEEVAKEANAKGIDAKAYLVQSNGEDMKVLAQLLESGTIKPHVFKTYPFDQLAEAHKQVASGHTKGKVVLSL